MKSLREIDLTKEGEPQYITYFYHKHNKFVFKVISDGTRCALYLAEKCGINKDMKFGGSLPKYILNKLD